MTGPMSGIIAITDKFDGCMAILGWLLDVVSATDAVDLPPESCPGMFFGWGEDDAELRLRLAEQLCEAEERLAGICLVAQTVAAAMMGLGGTSVPPEGALA